MKLKWSEVRKPTMEALEFFEYERKPTFMAGVNGMYDRFRGTIPERVPEPGPATEAFNALKAGWDAAARKLCGPKERTLWGSRFLKPSHEAKAKKPQPKLLATETIRPPISLMYGEDGKTVFRTEPPPHGTSIEAIQYDINLNLRERSRLNLVVRPECGGESLREKLFLCGISYRAVIKQWKVMSPTLGATGSESAVIYLGVPLDDAKVKGLVCELQSNLRAELLALNSCPFGLEKIVDGIYGCDLPGDDKEKPVFDKNTSDASAGRLMSMIICKAAWQTAEDIFHGPNKRKTTEAEEERLLKSQLARVLQDIGWELEN